jgi:hypothetical protein
MSTRKERKCTFLGGRLGYWEQTIGEHPPSLSPSLPPSFLTMCLVLGKLEDARHGGNHHKRSTHAHQRPEDTCRQAWREGGRDGGREGEGGLAFERSSQRTPEMV